MKKLNPRIIAITMIMLSILVTGSFAVKDALAPPTGAIEEEIDPSGG